jgi:hypothetical protein
MKILKIFLDTIKDCEKVCSVFGGHLISLISLLENGRDIMPTPQQWQGSYTYK